MLEKLRNVWPALSGGSLAFFGLMFHRAWVYISIPQLTSSVSEIGPARQAFDVMVALSALALALASLRAPQERVRRQLPVVAAGLQVATALATALCGLAPAACPALAVAGCALGAAGIIAMAVSWCCLYAALNPVRVAFFFSGSTVLGALLAYLLESNPAPRVYVVMALLPLLSLACLRAGGRVEGAGQPSAARPEPTRRARAAVPWKALAFIATYAFAYGVSLTVVPAGASGRAAIALPALVILGAILLDAKKFNFEIIYRMAFPLMVCGFMLLAIVPGLDGAVAASLVAASYSAAEALIVLVLCGLSLRTGASACWLFGLMKAVQYGSKSMGMSVGGMIGRLDPYSHASVVAIVLIAFLVIGASALLLSERSVFSNWGLAPGRPARGAADGAADSGPRPMARIEAVGTLYGLTQREMEVLLLLVQGKTIRAIAADMFIAEGTVKAHVQHIYQKMGVHNRAELIGAFDAAG